MPQTYYRKEIPEGIIIDYPGIGTIISIFPDNNEHNHLDSAVECQARSLICMLSIE